MKQLRFEPGLGFVKNEKLNRSRRPRLCFGSCSDRPCGWMSKPRERLKLDTCNFNNWSADLKVQQAAKSAL